MSDDSYYPSYLNRDRLVYIVDTDARTCESLSVLLRLEGFQTAFFLEASSFLSALERRRPDAVVCNMHVGAVEGLTLLRRVKGFRTGSPIFMLTDEHEVTYAVEAMKEGASDVLTKPVDGDQLIRSVRAAFRQPVHLGPPRGGRRPVEIRGFAHLTPREREVLQLISNGESNKEAGRELGISPRTIEVHRARIMEKLGARNTADLMRIVLTAGV
jgi:FixJ family two-component response regulator